MKKTLGKFGRSSLIKFPVWLFAYLIIHADRKSGALTRKYQTIAVDMGVPARTIRRWMVILRQHRYVDVESTGRSLVIHIRKWRSISTLPRVAGNNVKTVPGAPLRVA